jgi:hypothetical protein
VVILFDAAMNLRCARADRLGWISYPAARTLVSGSQMRPAPEDQCFIGGLSRRISLIVVDLRPVRAEDPVTVPGSTLKLRSSTASVLP